MHTDKVFTVNGRQIEFLFLVLKKEILGEGGRMRAHAYIRRFVSEY
jgi:hypothetical protein